MMIGILLGINSFPSEIKENGEDIYYKVGIIRFEE